MSYVMTSGESGSREKTRPPYTCSNKCFEKVEGNYIKSFQNFGKWLILLYKMLTLLDVLKFKKIINY